MAVFYAGGALEKELERHGLTVFDLRKSGRWDMLPFFMRLSRYISALQPDVVYSFLTVPNLLAVFFKFVAPAAKIVWGVRGSGKDFSCYDWLIRWSYRLECLFSRFADLIIANSQAGYHNAVKNGFPARRMVVIHNGIDTERFKPDMPARRRLRTEWGMRQNAVLIGVIARLDPMKDHRTFLSAAAMLARERPDVYFVCAGAGLTPYKNKLHQLADESGLNGRLFWLGVRRDIPAVCSALDILVSSSSFGEGFSNVIGEAMACGVPCVVTDVGDSALIVKGSGCVVPPARPDALYQGLCAMLENLKPELRNKARHSIMNRFTDEVMAGKTINALMHIP